MNVWLYPAKERWTSETAENLGMNLDENSLSLESMSAEGRLRLHGIWEKEQKRLSLTIPPRLTMQEYDGIHLLILRLQKQLAADVDDTETFMGYTESGEEAYLIRNWKAWTAFLRQAGQRSLSGHKVRVTKEGNTWEGLLLDYCERLSPERYQITECLLLTNSGEISVQGTDLLVEPTGDMLQAPTEDVPSLADQLKRISPTS
ncbi:hypothetical protein [Alkalicoccus urumqiensis]|uniref:hypothetical protein n=1 Tax=Alkalicoccus urumqiensis TaxID=1548213 RepID=UPI00115C2627|nr:hypothetical protein [Alkalicoccus urumqiensis]